MRVGLRSGPGKAAENSPEDSGWKATSVHLPSKSPIDPPMPMGSAFGAAAWPTA